MKTANEEKIKKLKNIDGESLRQYLIDREVLKGELKDRAMFLASTYGENIQIVIDVNPKVQSAKLSVKEFL